MSKIYKYDTRYMVEFSNGSRASYSKIRYGELLDLVTTQAIHEDRKIWNPYIQKDDYLEILYWDQNQKEIISFLVDADQKHLIYDYYFQTNVNGYAQTRTGGRKQYLHHIIIENSNLTDHINRNRVDNRRENLRNVTFSENNLNASISSRNTSGVTGVSFDSNNNKWRARIQFNFVEKTEHFDSFEQAVEKRKEWEEEIIQNNYKGTFND